MRPELPTGTQKAKKSAESANAVASKTLAFHELRSIARQQTREEFVRSYPHPFLVAETAGDLAAPAQSFRTTKGLPSVGVIMASRAARLVYPVIKTARNHFADMVTIGRAYNNDLIIDEQAVSKFHAYFSREPGGDYVLCDGGSAFGTSLQGHRLQPNSLHPVASGDSVTLGEVIFTFYLTDVLYDKLTGTERRGP